jgi:hypothetical protein
LTGPSFMPHCYDDRLDEVARLLAEAMLRARHRRILKGNLRAGTREKALELSASSRTHGSRNGERK